MSDAIVAPRRKPVIPFPTNWEFIFIIFIQTR